MPEVIVHMAAGRTPEQKKKLMASISEAVVNSTGAALDAVTVQIVEAPLSDKMKGGQTFAERAAAKAKS
ncbi:MAG: tautomerase [Proteobacteria bacterium]|nr:MAG: tautomerase [Pseudomonadota bacterium]